MASQGIYHVLDARSLSREQSYTTTQSLAMCTILAPVLGYDKAAALAKQAAESGQTIPEVVCASGLIPDDEIDRLLDPRQMTEPGLP